MYRRKFKKYYNIATSKNCKFASRINKKIIRCKRDWSIRTCDSCPCDRWNGNFWQRLKIAWKILVDIKD